jgi:hypothetical protein
MKKKKKKKLRLRKKIQSKPKIRKTGRRGVKRAISHTVSEELADSALQSKPAGPKTGELLVEPEQAAPGFAESEDMERMSEVVVDFAAPLLETCEDESSEKKAVSLAIFVWNATLLPEEGRENTLGAYLADAKKSLPPEEFQTLSSYVDLLIERKRSLYPSNRKKITGCTFGGYGENRRIEVGYTVD